MNISTRAIPSNGLRGLALLAVLVLALMPRAAGAAAHEVPFSAAFTTEFESAVVFPIAHISVTGDGYGLHMGRSTAVTTDQSVNLITGEGAATYTLTAANGDTVVLSLEFTIAFQPTGVTFEGTYVVTGGTGRFAGATGSGSASGSATFTGMSNGFGSFAVDGTISK